MKAKILIIISLLLIVSCSSVPQRGENESIEIRTQAWVLPITHDYYVRKVDGVHNFYKENAKGALQLSSMVSRTPILDQELIEIAQSQINGAGELTGISGDGKRGYKSVFTSQGVYWVYWFIVIDHSLIFITYNTDSDKIDANEIKNVEAVVNGISST
ncbi:hypothetical protein CWC22_011275 [Pseudoalteromonas rubra]|uniref:DUF3805 domain-containing protein n=1 Tax=Pseudoalteromonas rubra TaxID=43658 RepID=A0A5S3V3X8_9GAMM|nr:hypothetical protein [Pseudoalteromonas rubra]QPB83536.1 hypothetical protein CWC22_011275 [Pseudoalteromonas rubra]